MKVKGHAGLYCLVDCVVSHVQLHSLCVSEAIDLPLLHLKDDEKPHNVRWMKNTIAIVYSEQKDEGDALIEACVHVRLCKPGNEFFLFHMLLERKHRSSDFSPQLHLVFLRVI